MTYGAQSAERLLCDTSFVAWSAKAGGNRERYGGWPKPVVAMRIEQAIMAISVITLAEARYGHRKAGWGEQRVAKAEQRLATFLHIPLDATVLDKWAHLKEVSVRSGWNITDNDLWIAATASARDYPLVTCDAGQARIAGAGVAVLHIPPPD